MLFARHFAWLSAIPDGQKKSRRELFVRLAKKEPDLPTANVDLIALFYRVGPSRQTGMGMVPATWGEIESFLRLLQVRKTWTDTFTMWVAETLYLMSGAYVGQFYEARARECPPPWEVEAARKPQAETKLNEGILKAFEAVKSSKPTKRKGLRSGPRNNSV